MAVEPVAEFRALAQRLHADHGVEWIDDALPDLRVVRTGGRRFDLVLMSAVWMHLDAPERVGAMDSVPQLLAPGGRVIMSLRHGPVPTGRRMFDVSSAETVTLAENVGLTVIHRGDQGGDPLGRSDVTWSVLGFELGVDSTH